MTQGRAKLPISVIVMTLNEHRNLPACLESVAKHVQAVFVVDSFSTDDTLDIARRHGCTVVQHPFTHQAAQFQWALDTLPLATDWVLRLDADERWTPEGFRELAGLLDRQDVSGINVRMRIMFMGRFLRHGGLYPNQFLRVFRRRGASIEQRWMDEHIRVDGPVVSSGIDVIEANYDRQQNIGLWTTKHNSYSTREAVDVLIARWKLAPTDSIADLQGGKTARKRWLKEHVYARVPLLVRPFLYFLLRYVLRGGFLDGRPGFIFHVLHGFWYRFLVDVKVLQLERLARDSGRPIEEVILDSYGIDLRRSAR